VTWQAARKTALARDEGKCRMCSQPATDVHHRQVKGMGGTSNPDTKYGMANLVSTCRECHTWIHGHPRVAYATGFLVHSGENPEEIFLSPGNMIKVRLTTDGDAEIHGNLGWF
jgi:hypothetical protein